MKTKNLTLALGLALALAAPFAVQAAATNDHGDCSKHGADMSHGHAGGASS